jgi:hypothetical protein
MHPCLIKWSNSPTTCQAELDLSAVSARCDPAGMSSRWAFKKPEIQRVLNQDGPAGRRAIGPDQGRIPVTARIVWSIEGEQYLEADATRWTKTQVFVRSSAISARLAGTEGVWINACDVVRR